MLSQDGKLRATVTSGNWLWIGALHSLIVDEQGSTL